MSQSDHLWKVPYIPLKFSLGSWLTTCFSHMHTNKTYYTEVHADGENIKMAADFRRV